MLLIEFKKFLFDKKILTAIIILFLFELILQMGFYKPLLKKNSYASNINRVTEHVIEKKNILNPDILIVGTSVAFEGISIRILNEELSQTGLKAQSLAVRGSEILVQHRILEEYLDKLENVKVIIHVMEPGMAWVDKSETVEPTLSMLSEIGNFQSALELKKFEYEPTIPNYLFLIFKSIAYRKDFADLIINFNERIKSVVRQNKNPNLNPWDYENDHPESMQPYHITSVDDCLNRLSAQGDPTIPPASNADHRRMLFETCGIANIVPKDSAKTPETDRYFRRLKLMYEPVLKKNIKIIHVFAPYSHVIREFNGEERMRVWQDGLVESLAPYQKLHKLDLQDSLGSDTSKYCFDLIHLNEMGMKSFSRILGQKLVEEIGRK
ncbi:hypothetical protein P3G55_10580 [Leptospira sp. 96542]|nr:hypothetical protein [Leptospira sp. 96542]